MRTPLMAGNWKMHKTVDEAVDLVQGLLEQLGGSAPEGRDVLVCPPATAISAVAAVLNGTGVMWGGQNMYAEREGAFTGEISPLMLVDLGCTHVILGHSERRHVFGEDDALINRKVGLTLDVGLVPILAVGEKIEQRRAGNAESTVIAQMEKGLAGVDAERGRNIVVAYEPVWAIGTGETASPEDAQVMHEVIRTLLRDKWGDEVAHNVRILYGGSVKPNNVDELMAQPDIDGALVGGASLQAESFARIVRFKEA
ncbi:MAG: triose-phosphate isomerase [Chloroflexota bacterium]|nr:triose-phosphate isomerase [Chloroflexota bacterium]